MRLFMGQHTIYRRGNKAALTQQYGQESVDSYLYSMITVSDNDAANALVGF